MSGTNAYKLSQEPRQRVQKKAKVPAIQTHDSDCLGLLDIGDMEREDLKKKTEKAEHVGKPDADNTVVLYDGDGNWVLEIYTTKHKVKTNGVDRS